MSRRDLAIDFAMILLCAALCVCVMSAAPSIDHLLSTGSLP